MKAGKLRVGLAILILGVVALGVMVYQDERLSRREWERDYGHRFYQHDFPPGTVAAQGDGR